jgi:6-pyruvoyltetrahydropterin/6-carboxytetrahydropterin synthase
VRLTRRYRFSASHRLDVPSFTVAENQRLFGKCNNPHGHGHDYVLDVTLEGSPDLSGQLVNRAALDALMSSKVLQRFDHRNLNIDVPEMAGVVPTTENLASAIRNVIASEWTFPARLHRVRVSETDRNIFELEA